MLFEKRIVVLHYKGYKHRIRGDPGWGVWGVCGGDRTVEGSCLPFTEPDPEAIKLLSCSAELIETQALI